MSRCLYDFLSDSFLLNPQVIASQFESYSDDDIVAELEAYLHFVDVSAAKVEARGVSALSAMAGDVEPRPSCVADMFMKAALYLDRLVLRDPVCELIWELTPGNQAIQSAIEDVGRFAGIQRGRLSLACATMYFARPLVAAGVLKFVPVGPSMPLHNVGLFVGGSPLEIPPEILRVYEEHATVRSCVWEDGVPRPVEDPPGEDTQTLEVEFGSEHATLYKRMATRIDVSDEGFAWMLSRHRDRLSQEQLASWIAQTVQEQAVISYSDLTASANLAEASSCSLLLTSPLAAQVLNTVPDGCSEVGPSVLDLHVPVVNAPLERLVDIRLNYGEAFAAFRELWNGEVSAIAAEARPEAIQQRVQQAWEKLESRAQSSLRSEWRKLHRTLLGDATIAVGSIAASFLAGTAVSAPIAVAAIGGAGLHTYVEYLNSVRNNPYCFVSHITRNEH